MPVFMITLHAYGTWMPDRPQGSVHWRRGLQPQSESLARNYRRSQRESSAEFGDEAQRIILIEFLVAAGHQRFIAYAAGLDQTHAHLLLSWTDGRTAERVRSRLKHSFTKRLNVELGRRTWFSKFGDEKRVRDRTHFTYLRETYLPGHAGVTWDRDRN